MAVSTDGYAPHSAYHKQSHPGHAVTNNNVLYNHSPVSQSNQNSGRIWDVWGHNFSEGMQLLRQLVRDSRFVAVDTEFPGVVAKVFGEYANTFEQAYHNIKVNIDMMKPIQIGFSFFNERGQSIAPISTVQFNIKWNVDNDTHSDDSIRLLTYAGIDFEKLKLTGIELHDFAEFFIASGLALNDRITWIGFHSAYDFAYMMKICTSWEQMPDNFQDFQERLLIYFPKILDLKTMSDRKYPKSGLQELADHMHATRFGLKHQAGSDAMLTGETFFRFLQKHGNGKFDRRILNSVYGLNYFRNGVANSWMKIENISSVLDSETCNLNISHLTHCPGSADSADNSGRSSPSDDNSEQRSN